MTILEPPGLEPSGPAHAPTHLTIDLDAIVANYKLLANRSAPASCAAVVKADAYGLGMDPVSRALADAGCQTFFVAMLDEGIALRAILPAANIFILNGVIDGEVPEFHRHRLIPVLNDPVQIEIWSRSCQSNTPQPAALQFDTGMARLGLTPTESAAVFAEPGRLSSFPIVGILSHLACANDPDHPLNQEQRARFTSIAAQLPAVPVSLSASSGIFLGSDWHFDIVRPGASLYGIAPTSGAPNPMRQVIRLQGKILQLRSVDTPQTVGYGATHKFAAPSRIATVAAGYADGYMRNLSGQGTAYIGDTRVPVVGRVSMDLITIDVTNVAEVKAGDVVDLIGPRNDVDSLATEAGTIGYEILTSLSRRYGRTYIGGDT
jgi:alanine racemase